MDVKSVLKVSGALLITSKYVESYGGNYGGMM